MGLKKAKETKVEEVDLEAMDVDEAAKAEAEEEDYHRRNRALRPRFQLDLTPDLKREKKAEQRVPSGGMKVAKAKLARNAVIDSDDDDDEEEVEKKKVERKIKSEDNKEASTSSASRKKSTAKMDYVEDEVDDHFLANEEDEAKGILDSMDREQYYPILLDFEDGEVVTAQAPQQDDDNPLAYRRDMNGKTVLENVEEEDNIASFVGQDGKDLVEAGDNFILFQFPVHLPERLEDTGGGGGGGGGGSKTSGGVKRAGKLQLFSDGTAEMKLDGITFDVSPGTLSGCRHEVGLLSTIENECLFLGSINNKQVCIPNINYLRELQHKM